MTGTCRLNNKSMRNIRRNEVYQCIAIDLAMLGVISKEECEMLIGGGIPGNLVLPSGKAGELVSVKEPEPAKPKTKSKTKAEPEPEPEPEPESESESEPEEVENDQTGTESDN